MSGGGIEIECVTPLSSVRSHGSSRASSAGRYQTTLQRRYPGAQIAVRPGHRIEQALLAGRQAERHRLEQLAMNRGRNGALGQQRAPRAIAGIERDGVGQALAAHRRAQAVGADQHVAFGGRAAGKLRDDARFVLRKRLQRAAAMIMRGRKRIAQDAVNALPGGQHLETFDGQRGAAVDVEELSGSRRHTEIARIEPERVEPCDQLGLRHDACAAAVELALHALEYVDCPAAPPQHDGGQKPAHRAADHQRAALRCHARRILPFIKLFQKSRRFSIFCPESLEVCHGFDDAG